MRVITDGPLRQLKFGPSASSSTSNPNTANSQQSVQGASGSASPTTTVAGGSGTINYNDPALGLGALQLAGSSILAALNNESGLQTQVAQNSAQISASSGDQLQTLQNELAQLAQYQGTNGGIQQSNNSKYIIWGAIAIGSIAALALLLKR